jgi:ABC-type glycerol-3-phosphate transport system substrate-binding protein
MEHSRRQFLHRLATLASLTPVVAGGLSSAACNFAATASDNVINLTLWVTYNPQEYEIFTQIAADFETQYFANKGRQIKLQLQRIPFDGLMPRLKYACMANATPDICRVDNAWPLTLAYGKALVPLDTLANFGGDIDTVAREYVPAAVESNVIDIKMDDGRRERHVYGLPDQTNCVALFWNKDMFQQAAEALRAADLDPTRAPQNWEEFIRYGKVLTIADKQQFGLGIFNSFWWSLPFFYSYGAQFLKQDAQGKFVCALDDPAAREALQLMTDLYKKHGIEAGAWLSGAINPEQGFLNGKYAMILSGPWNLKRFANINFGVSLVPAGPTGSISNVGGQNLVVFRSCKQPEAAYEFLRYFAAENVQLRWCEALGQIPVNMKALEKIDTKDRPNLAVFIEQMKTARSSPKIPKMDVMEDKVMNPTLQLAMQGSKPVAQALKDAAAQIDREFLPLLND